MNAKGRITAPMGILLAAALAVLLGGCGQDGPMDGENYGNLLDSPGGLVLVEVEHRTGYGRPDCLVCHELRSIHGVNRTGLPDCTDSVTEACLDLAEVRAIVRSDPEGSCTLCHGDNGVPK